MSEFDNLAVFVHSSFRTSSTWLWLAFRRNSAVRAYYEVFNESLAGMSPRDIAKNRFDVWNSKHPSADPYFLEFMKLVSPGGGVLGFLPDMAFGTFVPSDGLDGRLTARETSYISSLIAAAAEDGQKPVLTFCRSLGRVGAIKQHFGGWHIFLYRNLFRQWMSYLSQYYSGFAYFLSATHRTITLNQHDPFFALLAKRYISGDGDFGGFTDIERAFGGFVGLHLYLSMKAFAVADQVIEADRLADDPDYVIETQSTIVQKAGLVVDLTDARKSIESTGAKPYAPKDLADVVDELLAEAARHLGAVQGSACYNFGAKLGADLLDEEANYRHYTHSFEQQLAMNLAENKAALECKASLESSLAEATIRVRELEQRLRSMKKSASWRLTKPLRASARLVRKLRNR